MLMIMYSMTGSLIMRITYGIDVQPQNDPYITTAEAALRSLASAGNAGAFLGMSIRAHVLNILMFGLVDVIPICEHHVNTALSCHHLTICMLPFK